VMNDPIRALVDELAAALPPSERIKLLEAEIRLRARWGGKQPFIFRDPLTGHSIRARCPADLRALESPRFKALETRCGSE